MLALNLLLFFYTYITGTTKQEMWLVFPSLSIKKINTFTNITFRLLLLLLLFLALSVLLLLIEIKIKK